MAAARWPRRARNASRCGLTWCRPTRTCCRWICEYNGLAPCLVYRQIKEEEDKKAESEADKNVSEMGFELDEEAVREKYGDGWRKKATPAPVDPVADDKNPAVDGKKQPKPGEDEAASFAEAGGDAGQIAIDNAVAAVPDAELQAAMAGLVEPLLAAIESASSFEEALAAAETAFPKMDLNKLQALLARAMFGAEAFGRQAAD